MNFTNPFTRPVMPQPRPASVMQPQPAPMPVQRTQPVAQSSPPKASAIDTRSFDYSAEVDRLTPSLGRAAAVAAVVRTVGEAAAAIGDPSLIDALLPATVTIADGQVIDGPAKSARHAPAIASYRQQAIAQRRR